MRESRSSRIRSKVAAGLLILAALVWGLVWIWQAGRSRVQRHIEAGIEAAQLGQGEKAEQEWRIAVRLDPRNEEAWNLLGGYYLSTNNQPAAVEAYRRLLQLRPHNAEVEGRLADSTLRTGDEVAALRYALDALKGDPNNIAALNVAARLLGDLQDEKLRLDYLRRLVKLQPNDPSALSELAIALNDNQLYAEATPVLEHLLQLNPNNAEAYALRGEIRSNQDPSPQGSAQAEADFNRALQLDPLAAFPRFNLGKLYLQEGHATKAILQLEESARLLPNKPDIYFELARAYQQAGKPRQAEAARQRFVALRAEADLASSLEKRCVTEPQNFSIHKQLGLLKLQEGDYRKAGFYLNAAHTLQPTDAQINTALQQLALRNR